MSPPRPSLRLKDCYEEASLQGWLRISAYVTTKLEAKVWPLASPFVIARETKTLVTSLNITLAGRNGPANQPIIGIGESIPYRRYGEEAQAMMRAATLTPIFAPQSSSSIGQLLTYWQSLKAGALRNAMEAALWDYLAKASQRPVWSWLGHTSPPSPQTCFNTVSLADAEQMATQAKSFYAQGWRHLKLKLAGDGRDPERLQAVRNKAPDAILIADANEGFHYQRLIENAPAMIETGLELLEQPLPAHQDQDLDDWPYRDQLPLCADESFHTREDLPRVLTRYQALNIKLDKTGGLCEALACAELAHKAELKIMVGCMASASLAVIPALMLNSYADYLDLDGPMLLLRDDPMGLIYHQAMVAPASFYQPNHLLWGGY